MTISFRVYGIPQTKGSAKAFYRPGMRFPVVMNDNPRNKPWSQTVSAVAQQHRPSSGLWPGPVRVILLFYLPIPKSLPKRRPFFMVKRPDIDKCTRSILDAIKGVIYRDDSQVVGLEVAKLYGLEPGVVVQVEQLNETYPEASDYLYHPMRFNQFAG